MRLIWIIILALSAASPAFAQEMTGRAALEAFAQDLSTLQARFRQVIVSSDGRVEDEGEGSVWLRHPGLFRWSYEGDYPELIVADGQNVWLYDEVLEQVTVKPQSLQAENSPLLLLTDADAIDEQFDITELGTYESLDLLSLVSRSADAEFERILLGFDGAHLALMALEDAFGLRTEIRFSEVQRNSDLDSELFRFEPPPGTDVVGEIAQPVSATPSE